MWCGFPDAQVLSQSQIKIQRGRQGVLQDGVYEVKVIFLKNQKSVSETFKYCQYKRMLALFSVFKRKERMELFITGL